MIHLSNSRQQWYSDSLTQCPCGAVLHCHQGKDGPFMHCDDHTVVLILDTDTATPGLFIDWPTGDR